MLLIICSTTVSMGGVMLVKPAGCQPRSSIPGLVSLSDLLKSPKLSVIIITHDFRDG